MIQVRPDFVWCLRAGTDRRRWARRDMPLPITVLGLEVMAVNWSFNGLLLDRHVPCSAGMSVAVRFPEVPARQAATLRVVEHRDLGSALTTETVQPDYVDAVVALLRRRIAESDRALQRDRQALDRILLANPGGT